MFDPKQERAADAGPVVIGVTAIAASMAAVNGFTGFLAGAPPFWLDSISTVLVSSAALVWVTRTLHVLASNRRARGRLWTARDLTIGLGAPVSTSIALIALAVWNSWMPVERCFSHPWQICGTFSSVCGNRACLLLYDARNRPIYNYCHAVADDSGFVMIKPAHWWTYQPKYGVLVCGDQRSQPFRLSSEFTASPCEAIKEF